MCTDSCNIVYGYAYYNFFFLFLQLNGSVNGLKPRIYYTTYNIEDNHV